jgi:putative flippase GtrA
MGSIFLTSVLFNVLLNLRFVFRSNFRKENVIVMRRRCACNHSSLRCVVANFEAEGLRT